MNIICQFHVAVSGYGTLGTTPKSLENTLEELEIRGRAETILITVFLQSRWIKAIRITALFRIL